MRRVAILAFDGAQTLDVTGPWEVLSMASRIAGGDEPAYKVEIVAGGKRSIRTGSGLSIVPDRDAYALRGPLDTLLIAGGDGVLDAIRDERLVRWVARTSARARRTASVCTGAYMLAQARLLDGRRAATHWAGAAHLAASYPRVQVDPESIYVCDGDVWTSAGVTAGMDLSLALVEEDLGRDVALETARWLVMFVKRPGGQAQFSSHLRAQAAERAPLKELQEWMTSNLAADLGVPSLAARACMSERNFARAFRDEVGMTPAAYVEALRVDHARLRLESTGQKLEAVAAECGFGTVETMRRAFHRRLGVSPHDYRTKFQTHEPREPREEDHADRDPAVRQIDRARRRRAV